MRRAGSTGREIAVVQVPTVLGYLFEQEMPAEPREGAREGGRGWVEGELRFEESLGEVDTERGGRLGEMRMRGERAERQERSA